MKCTALLFSADTHYEPHRWALGGFFWLLHGDVVGILNRKSKALQRERRLTSDYEVMIFS